MAAASVPQAGIWEFYIGWMKEAAILRFWVGWGKGN